MEYSPWAKINKSPKEKQALIDAPPPKLSDKDKSILYRPVRKKNKEEENKEKAKPTPHGIKPNIDWYKKGGKISTAEHGNSKHKHCW